MVYRNELSGSFYDVFILRIESNEVRMMYISLPKPKTTLQPLEFKQTLICIHIFITGFEFPEV